MKAPTVMTSERMRKLQSTPRQMYVLHACCGKPLVRVDRKEGWTVYRCACGKLV